MIFRCCFIAVLLVLSGIAGAQQRPKVDTLAKDEYKLLRKGSQTSAYACYQEARRYSRMQDSSNTDRALMKVDPYYLMFSGCTADSIDTFLERNFNLTSDGRRAYAAKFRSVYAAQRTAPYTMFRAMYDQDRKIRMQADKCADSFTCARVHRRMDSTDSAHVVYLNTYISKSGWPNMANGSMYAVLPMLHDYGHYAAYVPALKAAVLKGDVTLEVLQHVLKNELLCSTFGTILDTLRDHEYMKFDVSSVLRGGMPASLGRIEATARRFCNVKRYIVYQAADAAQVPGRWLDKRNSWETTLSELVMDISNYMCKESEGYLGAKHGGSFTIYGLPSEGGNQPQLFLYIVRRN